MSKQSERKAKRTKSAQKLAQSMGAAAVGKIQNKNKSDGKTDNKPKQSLLNWVKNHKITTALGTFFVFSLSGLINYFGNNPRILYLPAFAACILFCWIIFSATHRFVESKLNDTKPQVAFAEESNKAADQLDTNSMNEIADVVSNILSNKKIPIATAIPADMSYPGLSAHLVLRLERPISGRNNFIMDIGEDLVRNRTSIFIDPDGNLCFRVIGENTQPVTLQVKQSFETFNYEDKIWLACEYGQTETICFLRMYINGNKVAENLAANPMSSPTVWTNYPMIVGQDIAYQNSGIFQCAEVLTFKATMSVNQLHSISTAIGYLEGFHNK